MGLFLLLSSEIFSMRFVLEFFLLFAFAIVVNNAVPIDSGYMVPHPGPAHPRMLYDPALIEELYERGLLEGNPALRKVQKVRDQREDGGETSTRITKVMVSGSQLSTRQEIGKREATLIIEAIKVKRKVETHKLLFHVFHNVHLSSKIFSNLYAKNFKYIDSNWLFILRK